MKVSVLLPTYNRGYIIGEALESIFAQTFSDFEIVVVDDGSSDATSQVVQGFPDPRLRYICHEKNAGYGAAMNSGFSAARYELISILDSDDLWKPEKLQCEVEFLQRHPEVDALFSDLEKYDGKVHVSSFMRQTAVFSRRLVDGPFPGGILISPREMYLYLLQEVPIKMPAFTLRREALTKVGNFDESWPSGNDWDFLLRLSKFARFGYIDRPLAVIRVQDDATHRIHVVRDHMLLLDLLRREREGLGEDSEARAAVRRGITNLTKHLAWHYLGSGQRSEAARTFIQGFAETGDWGLLPRAVGAYFPMGIRSWTKRLLGRQGS